MSSLIAVIRIVVVVLLFLFSCLICKIKTLFLSSLVFECTQSHFSSPQWHTESCNRATALLYRGPWICFLIIIIPELFVTISDCLPSCMPLACFYFRNQLFLLLLLPPPFPNPHISSGQVIFKYSVYVSDLDLLRKDILFVFIGQAAS